MRPATAARDNAGKPPLSDILWFEKGIEALAIHIARGREKYPDTNGRPNWDLGGKPDSEYFDAIARHLGQAVRGEVYDQESGTPHLAAVAWNALAYLSLNLEGPTSVDIARTGEAWAHFASCAIHSELPGPCTCKFIEVPIDPNSEKD